MATEVLELSAYRRAKSAGKGVRYCQSILFDVFRRDDTVTIMIRSDLPPETQEDAFDWLCVLRDFLENRGVEVHVTDEFKSYRPKSSKMENLGIELSRKNLLLNNSRALRL